MSDLEQELHAAARGVLRAGEQITGCGLVSRVVPAAARIVPLLPAIYGAHYLMVATGERLVFFPTSLGMLGGASSPRGTPVALEICDLASVEAFNPLIIGHSGLRLTTRLGLAHELMYPSSVRNLGAHAAFASGFGGWLAPFVASGAAPRRPDAERNLAPLPPRPAVGTWLLLIAGALLTLGSCGMSALVISQGFLEGLAAIVPVLGAGALALFGGVYLRRQRAAQLGAPAGRGTQTSPGSVLTGPGVKLGVAGLLLVAALASGALLRSQITARAGLAREIASQQAQYDRDPRRGRILLDSAIERAASRERASIGFGIAMVVFGGSGGLLALWGLVQGARRRAG